MLLTPLTIYTQESNPFFDLGSKKDEHQKPDLTSSGDDSFQVTIDPRHRTDLSAEVVSPVESINKKMGESFKKGDVLIQLNDVLFASNLKKAESALDKARVELDAKKRLFNDNVASYFELKEGESNLATAQADLTLAKRNLSGTKIIAPYDGKVISVNIEEHEIPQLGKSMIEIVDDQILIARFLVPSSFLPKLKVGMSFEILIMETGQKVPLKISRIGSVIDPSSGTVKIEADIDNSKDSLRTGMTGRTIFKS